MTEASLPSFALTKLLHHFKPDLLDRHKYHLRDALAWLNVIRRPASIPAGNIDLPLIIGIDQPCQVAEDQAMFVAEPRARQQHRCQLIVRNMYRDTGRHQYRLSR